MPTDKNELTKKVKSLASQCVKCGLCLSHCPTYGLSEDENESPRGRIEILQALAQNKLTPTKKTIEHLDRCLSCRHCERVCPAHVQYEQLLTTGKRWLNTQEPPLKKLVPLSWKTKFLTRVVTHPARIKTLGKLLRLLQVSSLRWLGKYSGLTYLLRLNSLDNMLPKVPSQKPFQTVYPPKKYEISRVGLFLGCLSRWCDRNTPLATIHVLNHCGVGVIVPKDQGCCGAMAHHQGDYETTYKLLEDYEKNFIDTKIDTIITTASGCGAMLIEAKEEEIHPRMTMSPKIEDICHYVLPKLQGLKLKPLNLKVALHTPCTLQNGMKQSHAPYQLLKQIPNLQVFKITERDTCCGSAGTYMLEHPHWSNQLVQKILKEVSDIRLDFIATSNIGCALHLQKAIKDCGMKTKVVHPIALVAYSLGWQS